MDPLTMSLLAGAGGQAAGSILGSFLSRGDRRRQEEALGRYGGMAEQLYGIGQEQALPLVSRLSREALDFGTPEDLAMRGGLSSARYLRGAESLRDQERRALQRYGVNPESPRYRGFTEQRAIEDALGSTEAYNRAVLGREGEKFNVLSGALSGVGQGMRTMAVPMEGQEGLADFYGGRAGETVSGAGQVGGLAGQAIPLMGGLF